MTKRLGFIRFALLLVAALSIGPASAQHIHRNNFEAAKTFWIRGGGDGEQKELKHLVTDEGAHSGERSEFIQLDMKQATFQHYLYPVGKAPINDDLTATLWLKANRPGLQLMARIVLPQERDPKNLEAPLTTMIRGDVYQNTGRWQRIGLSKLIASVKQQQQLLQAQSKGAVNFNDAYIDALILNVYGGPGPTEVWIDDLEIGPVMQDAPQKLAATPTGRPVPATPPSASSGNRSGVEFNGSHLMVGGKAFFIRGIRVTDTPLKVLQAAGFNTVFFDAPVDPKLIKQAADLGLWVVPQLPVVSDDPKYATAEGLGAEAQRLADQEGILFHHLGRTLTNEQVATVQRATQLIRQADPGRPLGADVWDGLMQHSRSLNLTALHRWPLMTSLELPRYRDWLESRRRLMNPGAYTWTWIQNHIPEASAQILYGQAGYGAFAEPVGPQPEQIRLLAYSAIASGMKGVAYWSDRFLADSHQGRDRLLMCALLNQEIEMLEPLLAGIDEAPQWIATSNADVSAAVLRSAKGILVLPIWQGRGAQFVPGQGAASKLTVVVPQVPASMQPWEVLPGEVRGLKMERVVGGTKVTIPEFGLTTAVVFTSDTNNVVRFQEGARGRRQQAAQWTYDMAAYEMEKVLKVEGDLQAKGHVLSDATSLATDARARLDTAKRLWDTKLYSESYRESQRALRPLRILMRAQWEAATKQLDSPVSSPFATTFFTLPKHWEMMDLVKASTPGPNVLLGGDFESVPTDPMKAWKIEEPTLDEVEMICIRVSEIQGPLEMKSGGAPSGIDLPKEGKQCAMLQIKPRNRALPPQALERTLLALTSPSVSLPPGTLVQISGWVRIPAAITTSPDGALFYDSIGGEPFAIRLTEPTPWKKLTLYRRVPASGQISVTLAMTGFGSVYFDDVRVEPLNPSSSTPIPGNLVSNPKQ